MDRIKELEERIKDQEEYIRVIRTEQLQPATDILIQLKRELAMEKSPFEIGDKITNGKEVVVFAGTDPSYPRWYCAYKIKKDGQPYLQAHNIYGAEDYKKVEE